RHPARDSAGGKPEGVHVLPVPGNDSGADHPAPGFIDSGGLRQVRREGAVFLAEPWVRRPTWTSAFPGGPEADVGVSVRRWRRPTWTSALPGGERFGSKRCADIM